MNRNSSLRPFGLVFLAGFVAGCTGQNHKPPVAKDDVAFTPPNTSVDISVLDNDTDPNGDHIFCDSYAQAQHGKVFAEEGKIGVLKYVPESGFSGTDSFEYTVTDHKAGFATAKVTVVINQSPIAMEDAVTALENTPLDIDVLANDSDPDQNSLTVLLWVQAAHGSVTLNPDQSLKYTPQPGYSGADSFSYTASDGHQGIADSTVSILVNAPPSVADDSVSTVEEVAVTIPVLSNDSDPEGNPLVVSGVTAPPNGAASVNSDNTVTYTPNPSFFGTDSFSYTLLDGQGGTASANVEVIVRAAPHFAAAATFSTGNNPVAVASADFDLDGLADLASANNQGNSVSVLKNATSVGSSVLVFNSSATLVAGSRPGALAADDYDQNGKPDLVVANGQSDTVSLYDNTSSNGAMSFAAKRDFSVGPGPVAVAFVDLGGKAGSEIIAVNSRGDSVSVLDSLKLSGGHAIDSHGKTDFSTGAQPAAIAVADLDGDGLLDLATANQGDDSISLLRNTDSEGAPSFAAKLDLAAGIQPKAISSGDLNGDGKPDLVIANSGDNSVSVLENVSSGPSVLSFSRQDSFLNASPKAIFVGDLTGDGLADIVTANADGTVSVFVNLTQSPGTTIQLTQALSFDFRSSPSWSSVILRDLNGDERLDLILGTTSEALITAVPGASPSNQ